MSKPTLFVGSSTEAEWLIDGLVSELGDDVTVTPWRLSLPLSRATLDGLEERLEETNFAAFILAADDLAIIRGQTTRISRDNVLFELGLAFGLLGRDQTIMLTPAFDGAERRTPTDLLGITAAEYQSLPKPKRKGDQKRVARQAMQSTATTLRNHMDLVVLSGDGVELRRPGKGVLRRGDTRALDSIADAVMHVFESRDAFLEELRKGVMGGERLKAKFQFAQGDGGHYWLRLCRAHSYTYYRRASKQLKGYRGHLAQRVREATGTAGVDLISLGSGDGSKDDLLLHALAAELGPGESIYYYPIDISDTLLVEAVRKVARNRRKAHEFRCKPVLGDFTNLASLAGVISYRPNPNLFSVLGNVLGTFDEQDILGSLSAVMAQGDLVLFEVNVGDPEGSKAVHAAKSASQWDLSTLDALGIDRQTCDLRCDIEMDVSDVPRTKTLVSCAVPSAPEADECDYVLSGMHHYDFQAFKTHILRELHLELIDDRAREGVGFLLGRRR